MEYKLCYKNICDNFPNIAFYENSPANYSHFFEGSWVISDYDDNHIRIGNDFWWITKSIDRSRISEIKEVIEYYKMCLMLYI